MLADRMIQFISSMASSFLSVPYNVDHFWLLLDLLKTWSELVCRLCIPLYVKCMMWCTTAKLVPWMPVAVASEFVAKSVVDDTISECAGRVTAHLNQAPKLGNV